jgi:hypothetical protein
MGMKVRCSFCHETKEGYARYPERDLLCIDCYAKYDSEQLSSLKEQIDKIMQGMNEYNEIRPDSN